MLKATWKDSVVLRKERLKCRKVNTTATWSVINVSEHKKFILAPGRPHGFHGYLGSVLRRAKLKPGELGPFQIIQGFLPWLPSDKTARLVETCNTRVATTRSEATRKYMQQFARG